MNFDLGPRAPWENSFFSFSPAHCQTPNESATEDTDPVNASSHLSSRALPTSTLTQTAYSAQMTKEVAPVLSSTSHSYRAKRSKCDESCLFTKNPSSIPNHTHDNTILSSLPFSPMCSGILSSTRPNLAETANCTLLSIKDTNNCWRAERQPVSASSQVLGTQDLHERGGVTLGQSIRNSGDEGVSLHSPRTISFRPVDCVCSADEESLPTGVLCLLDPVVISQDGKSVAADSPLAMEVVSDDNLFGSSGVIPSTPLNSSKPISESRDDNCPSQQRTGTPLGTDGDRGCPINCAEKPKGKGRRFYRFARIVSPTSSRPINRTAVDATRSRVYADNNSCYVINRDSAIESTHSETGIQSAPVNVAYGSSRAENSQSMSEMQILCESYLLGQQTTRAGDGNSGISDTGCDGNQAECVDQRERATTPCVGFKMPGKSLPRKILASEDELSGVNTVSTLVGTERKSLRINLIFNRDAEKTNRAAGATGLSSSGAQAKSFTSEYNSSGLTRGVCVDQSQHYFSSNRATPRVPYGSLPTSTSSAHLQLFTAPNASESILERQAYSHSQSDHSSVYHYERAEGKSHVNDYARRDPCAPRTPLHGKVRTKQIRDSHASSMSYFSLCPCSCSTFTVAPFISLHRERRIG